MADEIVQLERRMVHRLLSCWRTAQTDFNPPNIDALYAIDLGDLVQYLVLVELKSEDASPLIGLVGSAYRLDGHPDLTGRPISAVPRNSLLGRAVGHWHDVVTRGVPIILGGHFEDYDGQSVLYRSAILPICDDRVRVTHLICAANGKRVSQEAVEQCRRSVVEVG